LPAKYRIDVLLALCAQALIVLAVFLPFYFIEICAESEFLSQDRETRISLGFGIQVVDYREERNWGDGWNVSAAYGENAFPDVGTVMRTESICLVLAILAMSLFLASRAFDMRSLSVVLGLVAVGLCAVSVANIGLTMVDAAEDPGEWFVLNPWVPSWFSDELDACVGFVGSEQTDSTVTRWGPSIGWWMILVAGILQTASVLVTVLTPGWPCRKAVKQGIISR
jgi:hypothetical protein